jgi:hypothetical protein
MTSMAASVSAAAPSALPPAQWSERLNHFCHPSLLPFIVGLVLFSTEMSGPFHDDPSRWLRGSFKLRTFPAIEWPWSFRHGDVSRIPWLGRLRRHLESFALTRESSALRAKLAIFRTKNRAAPHSLHQ